MNEKHLKYRPEIDGLRAIAVLAVIFFHAEVSLFSGGFIGVDIFFVISGYLITKIIVSQLHENNFSFVSFYTRRIKRIFPAVFFLIVFTVLFGSLILTPDKFVDLAKSAIFSSAFLANVWFAKHSGYFDLAAEISPLVHLWSLAVEEQFYFIFPLLLFFTHKLWKFKGIKILLLFLFLFSFALSVILSSNYPNSSFYLLHTRAWELSLGGILIFLPEFKFQNRYVTNTLSIIGSLFIAISIFTFSKGIPYPGYWAMLPIIGTALVIASSHITAGISNSILSNSILVKIGKFSYSVYLWHWPIIVYYRIYISERSFYIHEMLLLILLSLFAGYLSWLFIEEKFRYQRISVKRVFTYMILSTALIMFVSFAIYFSHGFPERISEDARKYTRASMQKLECVDRIQLFSETDNKFCVIGKSWENARYKGMIWGDSHSLQWSQLFDMVGRQFDISFVIAPEECPPYLNSEYVMEFWPEFPNFTKNCTIKHRMAVGWLNKNPDIKFIVMAAAWSGHIRMLYDEQHKQNYLNTKPITERIGDIGEFLSTKAMQKTIASLNLNNKHIMLLGDIPRPNRSLNECYFSEETSLLRKTCKEDYSFLDENEVKGWHQYSDNALLAVASGHEAISSMILTNKFCTNGKCPTIINSELIYRDENHLRMNLDKETVEELGKKSGIDEYFRALLQQ
ncbi:MAG: acyltransferase [Nitrosomonas sp.]|nr:acyltransferase [Nitrosomonas sp.]